VTAHLFGEPEVVPGFQYHAEFLSPAEEQELLTWLPSLHFRAFEFHGFEGKRRVVSFGWKYDFAARRMVAADPLPGEVDPIRRRAAHTFKLQEDDFEQLLVTEYGPGAAIGWHKDKPTFGIVAGISLGAACTMRLRRKEGSTWLRRKIVLEPRSAYLLSGEARTYWEHSIPAVERTRYSLTFRTLAK